MSSSERAVASQTARGGVGVPGNGVGTCRPRIAAVVENAIQYQVPLFRQIERDGRLDLSVFYLTDRGREAIRFAGTRIAADPSLFEGYQWEILPNVSPLKNSWGFFDNFNPGLSHRLKKGNFDAVWFHGYNYAGLWLGFAACLAGGTPMLLRGESEYFFRRPPLRRAVQRFVLGPLFRRIDAFLYIGTHNRLFYETFGIGPERLFYVPYGVDNAWFQGVARERETWRQRIRWDLGLGEATTVFIYFSKHRHPKRPTDAVRAFCRLPAVLDATLLMLGDGHLRAEAEAAFLAEGKGHRVFFLGLKPYTELREYLAAADVLVFPSEENWGSAVNEALAAGLAVLCSDRVAGAIDMVRPGVNGFLFPSRDVDSLSRLMRSVCDNAEAREAMKRESLRVAETMSLQCMADGLVAAVNSVARVSAEPQGESASERRRPGRGPYLFGRAHRGRQGGN